MAGPAGFQNASAPSDLDAGDSGIPPRVSRTLEERRARARAQVSLAAERVENPSTEDADARALRERSAERLSALRAGLEQTGSRPISQLDESPH